MPKSIWVKVEEGHHQRYVSVCSVPATEHTEYIPASRETALREELNKARELIAETVRTFRPAWPNSNILDRLTAFLGGKL